MAAKARRRHDRSARSPRESSPGEPRSTRAGRIRPVGRGRTAPSPSPPHADREVGATERDRKGRAWTHPARAGRVRSRGPDALRRGRFGGVERCNRSSSSGSVAHGITSARIGSTERTRGASAPRPTRTAACGPTRSGARLGSGARFGATRRRSASANAHRRSHPLRLRAVPATDGGGTSQRTHVPRCGCWTWCPSHPDAPLRRRAREWQLLRESVHRVGSTGARRLPPRTGRKAVWPEIDHTRFAGMPAAGRPSRSREWHGHGPRQVTGTLRRSPHQLASYLGARRRPWRVHKPMGASGAGPAATPGGRNGLVDGAKP